MMYLSIRDLLKVIENCRITIHVLQLNIKKAEMLLLCYILVTTTKKTKKEFSAMATITQDMRYRLSLIKYAERFGVTKAAIKYKTNRQYIYRWKRRYDGSIESLRDLSQTPSSSKPTYP